MLDLSKHERFGPINQPLCDNIVVEYHGRYLQHYDHGVSLQIGVVTPNMSQFLVAGMPLRSRGH